MTQQNQPTQQFGAAAAQPAPLAPPQGTESVLNLEAPAAPAPGDRHPGAENGPRR